MTNVPWSRLQSGLLVGATGVLLIAVYAATRQWGRSQSDPLTPVELQEFVANEASECRATKVRALLASRRMHSPVTQRDGQQIAAECVAEQTERVAALARVRAAEEQAKAVGSTKLGGF